MRIGPRTRPWTADTRTRTHTRGSVLQADLLRGWLSLARPEALERVSAVQRVMVVAVAVVAVAE